MARRKRAYPLSVDGINRLVSDLEEYKRWLLSKTEQLLNELSSRGIKTASKRVRSAQGDSDKNVAFVSDISYSGNSVILTITAEGEDILFIEFGAGIHYNGGQSMLGKSPHPWGEEMGYAIGKFPKGRRGYSLGRFDSWTKPDGEESFGTGATMPMLGAMETIYAELNSACKKVFKR